MVVSGVWCIQSLFCMLEGRSVVCGEGCLLLFCVFPLK